METQALLDSKNSSYSFQKPGEVCEESAMMNAIPVILSFVPFIPILLVPSGIKMCSKNGPSDGLALSNGFGVTVIATTGIFLALAIYKRCAKGHHDSNISAEEKGEARKKRLAISKLSMGICSALIAINSIYLISLNLYCKFQ